MTSFAYCPLCAGQGVQVQLEETIHEYDYDGETREARYLNCPRCGCGDGKPWEPRAPEEWACPDCGYDGRTPSCEPGARRAGVREE